MDFDSHVCQCQRKFEEAAMGMSYIFAVIFFRRCSQRLFQLQFVSVAVKNAKLRTTSLVPVSENRVEAVWLRQGTALWVLAPLTRTVTFCMFKVAFLVHIHLSLWMETPLRSGPPVLLKAECKSWTLNETMHSDSSAEHEKWLLAVPDAAGCCCSAQHLQKIDTFFIQTKKTQIGEMCGIDFHRFKAS